MSKAVSGAACRGQVNAGHRDTRQDRHYPNSVACVVITGGGSNHCILNMRRVFTLQSAADVRFIRRTLAKAGPHGENVKIISKIENEAGLENYDAILRESDGIMVRHLHAACGWMLSLLHSHGPALCP